MYRGTCSYCQKENVLIETTPESGEWCTDCHRLARDNCNEAIRLLKAAGADKGKRSTADNLDVLRQQADNALKKLRGEG